MTEQSPTPAEVPTPQPSIGLADEPIRPDPAPPTKDDPQLERERWLRAQFEREHQVTMSVMRILLGSVRDEGRLMHAWRWLIDDIRSEHRRQEALYRADGQVDEAFRRRPWDL